MYQVSANGGDPRVLLPLDGKDDVDFHVPSVLPDGQTLIYAVHRQEGVDTIEALSGGTRHVLLRLEGRALEGPQVLNRPMFSPTGHLIYKLEQGMPTSGGAVLAAGIEDDWRAVPDRGRRGPADARRRWHTRVYPANAEWPSAARGVST